MTHVSQLWTYSEANGGASAASLTERLLAAIAEREQNIGQTMMDASHLGPFPVFIQEGIVAGHNREHQCISLSGSGDLSVFDGKPWELWELDHADDAGAACFVIRSLAEGYGIEEETSGRSRG